MFPIILHDNRFADAAPAASATATGYDVANLIDGRAYTYWSAAAAGTFYLSVAAPGSADALGLLGHNFATAGATVQVQSSNDGAAWTDRSPVITPPNGNKAFLQVFPQAIAAHSWRLKIVAATAAPRLAVALLGVRLQFPFPPESPYIPCVEAPVSEASKSRTGHLLGEVINYTELTINPRFASVARNWALVDYRAFWNSHGRNRLPFFWAWDLDVFPEHVYWVRHVGNHQEPISVASYIDNLVLDLEGVVE